MKRRVKTIVCNRGNETIKSFEKCSDYFSLKEKICKVCRFLIGSSEKEIFKSIIDLRIFTFDDSALEIKSISSKYFSLLK